MESTTLTTWALCAVALAGSAVTGAVELSPRPDPSLDPRIVRIRADLDRLSCDMTRLVAATRGTSRARAAIPLPEDARVPPAGGPEARLAALETALREREAVELAGWRALAPEDGRPERLSPARREFSAAVYRDVLWSQERPRRERVHAAEMLRRLDAVGDDDAAALVALVAEEPDESTRALSILAFAGLRDARWKAYLLDVVRNAALGHRPRAAAVVALVRCGKDAEIRALLETVARDDPSPPVRSAAGLALKGRL